jgi:hypothetical protein
VRPLRELPNAPRPSATLRILAWDPDEERTIKLSLPFWVLRLGKRDVW